MTIFNLCKNLVCNPSLSGAGADLSLKRLWLRNPDIKDVNQGGWLFEGVCRRVVTTPCCNSTACTSCAAHHLQQARCETQQAAPPPPTPTPLRLRRIPGTKTSKKFLEKHRYKKLLRIFPCFCPTRLQKYIVILTFFKYFLSIAPGSYLSLFRCNNCLRYRYRYF